MNNTQPILYGVIGLLSGIVIAGFTASYAVNNNSVSIMRLMGIHTNSYRDTSIGMMESGSLSMNQMMNNLQSEAGDNFDKVFLTEMIDHHTGAINMATEALNNAKHEEIKSMANDIITAQAKEIEQMKSWQKQWGY